MRLNLFRILSYWLFKPGRLLEIFQLAQNVNEARSRMTMSVAVETGWARVVYAEISLSLAKSTETPSSQDLIGEQDVEWALGRREWVREV